MWAKVREEVAAGRQAYVVCPLIEESEKLEVRSAEETYDELSRDELADLRLALLHGRMTSGEKEKTMALFRSGAIDVLVSTTVIEVGVDVPERDGHGDPRRRPVRHRAAAPVARSSRPRTPVSRRGACSSAPARRPKRRSGLNALVRTQDGFELAEVDLDIRGEGTIMGERQKGRNDLKLASLRRDREWVARAREVAIELVDDDPGLADHPQLLAEVEAFLDDEDREFLLKG